MGIGKCNFSDGNDIIKTNFQKNEKFTLIYHGG